MSGYSVGDRYLDHAGAYTGPAAEPARASRVQKKVTRTTTFDFGRGPYTVEDFKDFYEHIKDLPEGAKCSIQYWDDQRDGQSFKVTVNE